MAEKRQRGLREMWSLTVTNKKKKKDAAGNNVVKAYPNIVVNKVTKSIKIYQYFRYLKFASSASQNAGKCASKSLEIQNFLGGGACPQTPLESKALRALQLLLK